LPSSLLREPLNKTVATTLFSLRWAQAARSTELNESRIIGTIGTSGGESFTVSTQEIATIKEQESEIDFEVCWTDGSANHSAT
jgi:hypothetical protein